MQMNMSGFLYGKNACLFMDELFLWALFVSAQESGTGIPTDFIDAKKEEIKKDKSDSPDPAKEFIRRNREQARQKERVDRHDK